MATRPQPPRDPETDKGKGRCAAMRSSRADPGSDHLGEGCHRALVETQQDQTEKKSDCINDPHDKNDDENEDTGQEIYQDPPALRELNTPIAFLFCMCQIGALAGY